MNGDMWWCKLLCEWCDWCDWCEWCVWCEWCEWHEWHEWYVSGVSGVSGAVVVVERRTSLNGGVVMLSNVWRSVKSIQRQVSPAIRFIVRKTSPQTA